MANGTVNTGLGGSITFATSAHVFNWMSITPGDMARPDVDTSHLGTIGGRTFIPGDLVDYGSMTCEFQYDTQAAEVTFADAETITVTYPQDGGETASATIVGTGFVTSFTPGQMAIDELQTGTLSVRWDSKPTFTDATTV